MRRAECFDNAERAAVLTEATQACVLPHPWDALRYEHAAEGRRDLRIDWSRGLAMACVIVNHSRMSSLLSWFSYERFWVVTAAEVFVALSGIVLGMVYRRKLVRGGWRVVVRGLWPAAR